MPRSKKTKRRSGRVRIVAGEWRGRRIDVATAAALRPTPERTRETLFNWLAPALPGARVLDLYAGTGVLGLEALSRGAGHACFVERDRRLCAALRGTLDAFAAGDRGEVVCGDVFAALGAGVRPADIVLADPPYAAARHDELCTLLVRNGWLRPAAYVYLEQGATAPEPCGGARLRPIRSTRAGASRAFLLRYEGG